MRDNSIFKNAPLYQKTDKRIELKEVFKPSDYNYLIKAILLSKYCFKKAYPRRNINSIYFDTFDYASFNDSIEGSSIRSKTRLRWYGNSKAKTKAVLEVKEKQGHLSWKKLFKDIYTVSPSENSWEKFIQYRFEPESVDTKLFGLQPKSLVTYNREYYCSFDGSVRLTIDQKLRSFNQSNFTGPNLKFSTPHFGFLIFEIKVPILKQYIIKEVLKDLPFSAKRFSKYCESLLPQKYC